MARLVGWAVLVFTLILGAYLAVELLPPDWLGGVDRARYVSEGIQAVAGRAWAFVRPFLQLVLLLAILEAIVAKLGTKLGALQIPPPPWDIRTTIAGVVVVTFCLAALAGADSTSTLKDVALVVIGFYFGGVGRGRPGLTGALAPDKTENADGQ